MTTLKLEWEWEIFRVDYLIIMDADGFEHRIESPEKLSFYRYEEDRP